MESDLASNQSEDSNRHITDENHNSLMPEPILQTNNVGPDANHITISANNTANPILKKRNLAASAYMLLPPSHHTKMHCAPISNQAV